MAGHREVSRGRREGGWTLHAEPNSGKGGLQIAALVPWLPLVLMVVPALVLLILPLVPHEKPHCKVRLHAAMAQPYPLLLPLQLQAKPVLQAQAPTLRMMAEVQQLFLRLVHAGGPQHLLPALPAQASLHQASHAAVSAAAAADGQCIATMTGLPLSRGTQDLLAVTMRHQAICQRRQLSPLP